MIEWLGQAASSFTPEQYLWWTRLQCIAWTAADVVIVVALIRLANAARYALRRPPHLMPYLVLGCSMLFAPMVVLAPTGKLIFFIELLITIPHFLLILYVLAANQRQFREVIRRLQPAAGE